MNKHRSRSTIRKIADRTVQFTVVIVIRVRDVGNLTKFNNRNNDGRELDDSNIREKNITINQVVVVVVVVDFIIRCIIW